VLVSQSGLFLSDLLTASARSLAYSSSAFVAFDVFDRVYEVLERHVQVPIASRVELFIPVNRTLGKVQPCGQNLLLGVVVRLRKLALAIYRLFTVVGFVARSSRVAILLFLVSTTVTV
jgi:hypothetical protein